MRRIGQILPILFIVLVLIVAAAAPPVIIPGSRESVTRQLDRLDRRLPVAVHGRYFLTRERLSELITVLTETAQKYDEAAARGAETDV